MRVLTNLSADASKQVKKTPKDDCWPVAHLAIGSTEIIIKDDGFTIYAALN